MKTIIVNPALELINPITGRIRNSNTGEVFDVSKDVLGLLMLFQGPVAIPADLRNMDQIVETEDIEAVKAFVRDLIQQGILQESGKTIDGKMSMIEIADTALVETHANSLLGIPSCALDAEYPYQFALLGMPFDLGSTGYPGSRFGPSRLRELSLQGMDYRAKFGSLGCSGWPSENNASLCEGLRLVDVGDVIHQIGEPFGGFFNRIQMVAEHVLKRGAVPVSIGGDHSCLHPIMRAVSQNGSKRTHLIIFDAHTDLADHDDVISHNHGNVVTRIMKDELVAKVTHIGLRGMTGRRLDACGYNAIYSCGCGSLESIIGNLRIDPSEQIYISFDVDVIDPSFAPGTGTPVAMGLMPDTVLQCICSLIRGHQVVGLDVVEYNPMRDVNDVTGHLLIHMLPQIINAFSRTID